MATNNKPQPTTQLKASQNKNNAEPILEIINSLVHNSTFIVVIPLNFIAQTLCDHVCIVWLLATLIKHRDEKNTAEPVRIILVIDNNVPKIIRIS